MPDQLTPPGGDAQRAEKYIQKIIPLVSTNKLVVNHTDLSKFDPSSLEDHYRIDLKDYHLELSHSKQPNTGQDSYVLLFTNLQQIREGCSEKLILAYLNLSTDQFKRFKAVADEQIETRKRLEEEKRFKDAMAPIDDLLEKVTSGQIDVSQGPILQTTPPEPDSILPLVDSQRSTGTSTASATEKIDNLVGAAAATPPQEANPAPEPPKAVVSPPPAQVVVSPPPVIQAPVATAPPPAPDTSATLDSELASAFQPNINAVLTTPTPGLPPATPATRG